MLLKCRLKKEYNGYPEGMIIVLREQTYYDLKKKDPESVILVAGDPLELVNPPIEQYDDDDIYYPSNNVEEE